MAKKLLQTAILSIIFIILSSGKLFACPACNIHNYLAINVQSSSFIVIGTVIEAIDDNVALVKVVEVIRQDSIDKHQPGDTISKYVYKAASKIGTKMIFLNPMNLGAKFPTHNIKSEFEIRFLEDSSRKIQNIDEALHMIEGISRSSIRMGIDYLKDHYKQNRDILIGRIVKFRQEVTAEKEDYFVEFRIMNLVRALLSVDDSSNLNFLISEIDSIHSQPTMINWGKAEYNGKTFQGNYFRAMIKYSDEENRENIIQKMLNIIQTDSTSSVVYAAYALSFNHFNRIKTKSLSAYQKDLVAMGMAYTASERYTWRASDDAIVLVEKALDITTNSDLERAIRKRFKYLLKEKKKKRKLKDLF